MNWDLKIRKFSVNKIEKNYLQDSKKIDPFLNDFQKRCKGKNECSFKRDELDMRDECKNRLKTRLFNSQFYDPKDPGKFSDFMNCAGKDK